MDNLWDYYATEKQNPIAASKLLDEIATKFEKLMEYPNMGTARHELSQGIRMLPVGDFLILYRYYENCLIISRILFGGMYLEGLDYPEE